MVFGQIVEGMEVAQQINALARGKPGNSAGPEEEAIISDCGQVRGPDPGMSGLPGAGKLPDKAS